MDSVVLNANDMKRSIGRIAHEVLEMNQGAEGLTVVGVMKRGWPVAKRLAFAMTQVEGTTIPCGKLDVRRFRDDGSFVGPEDDSEVPFDVNGSHVILVDEVIYTGRTIRAALDALVKHGRPRRISLAVLVDRGCRELPIQPDFCGRAIATEADDHVIVKVMEIDGEDAVILSKKSDDGVGS